MRWFELYTKTVAISCAVSNPKAIGKNIFRMVGCCIAFEVIFIGIPALKQLDLTLSLQSHLMVWAIHSALNPKRQNILNGFSVRIL
jgi:hypothetical protein